MKSLSGIGLGLSVVFGCLLLALVAELYYLLWWKKRNIISKRTIDDQENGSSQQIPEERLDFLYIFFCCLKRPTSLRSQELCSSATLVHEPQQSSNTNKDSSSWLNKPFGGQEDLEYQYNTEILPRFLFTITEETREDLESEDGNNNNIMRGNLGNLLQILDTPPFLTPIGSPPYFTPPLTPSLDDNIHHENSFGPFLDPSSSPPPKFKFLRDAEEKLIQRRTKMGEIVNEKCGLKNKDEENGPFISIFVAKNQEEEEEGFCQHNNNHRNIFQEKECFSSSSSSQVLPLVSSPPIFKSTSPKKSEVELIKGC